MNQEDFDIPEIRTKRKTAAHMQHKAKTEFSKWIMGISTLIFAGTWIVAVISWFLWREFPTELTIFISICYGTESFAYMRKSGYENKAKIYNGFQGGDNK